MKTTLEWFRELPEPWQTAAINNCQDQNGQDGLLKERHSLEDALDFGIFWEGTKEGQDAWADLYNWADSEGVDPLTIPEYPL